MKSLYVFAAIVLSANLSHAKLTLECKNYRTHAVIEIDERAQNALMHLEDKEGYVTKGLETYELFLDTVESRKGDLVFVTSNEDYLIKFKLPKSILTRTPRKPFTIEFDPAFDGLKPRYNTLTCTARD
ncbi:hypothetical protein QJS83_08680 [Bdellovibrio sp. 22V]|uniref:hypothetical protein n=1 Tax=Bdellovibrio TaxID=958 RepID=UPI002542C266|nr:hypothetical protein [Bdellovibrio sp. 22V]WII70531.1 hypothetical protein QJS83_08680 [Bdellovibrio sp. 22V]